jgi:hypothetical protein
MCCPAGLPDRSTQRPLNFFHLEGRTRLGVTVGHAVVAEAVLTRHQILILNRRRKRAPNLRVSNRISD